MICVVCTPLKAARSARPPTPCWRARGPSCITMGHAPRRAIASSPRCSSWRAAQLVRQTSTRSASLPHLLARPSNAPTLPGQPASTRLPSPETEADLPPTPLQQKVALRQESEQHSPCAPRTDAAGLQNQKAEATGSLSKQCSFKDGQARACDTQTHTHTHTHWWLTQEKLTSKACWLHARVPPQTV
jgi:hypothetical protein